MASRDVLEQFEGTPDGPGCRRYSTHSSAYRYHSTTQQRVIHESVYSSLGSVATHLTVIGISRTRILLPACDNHHVYQYTSKLDGVGRPTPHSQWRSRPMRALSHSLAPACTARAASVRRTGEARTDARASAACCR